MLSTEQIEQYKRDGFLILPGYLPSSVVSRLDTLSSEAMTRAEAVAAPDPVFDFEPDLRNGQRIVQRIKKPHKVHPFFDELARSDTLLSLVEPLIGPNIRLHHSKINIKAPDVGSPLEWHQDWAFVPHSNRDMAFVSIIIDECTTEKGPMLMLPRSYHDDLRTHHHDGFFYGAIDVEAERLPLGEAVEVVGPPGTISIHHPLTIHGSGINRSRSDRRILFYEYAAADAWPIFHGVDYEDYDRHMVRGASCNEPRLDAVKIRMPFPRATQGMIYDIQRRFAKKYFAA